MNKLRFAFLGYGPDQTSLVDEILARGHTVECISEPISDLSTFDRTISFGYRHILRQPTLDTAQVPILNLHMSLLPYNRGSHPNFWAWAEGTPHGVTLHEMTSGLDEGPIVAQKEISFQNETITLRESYEVLFVGLEQLFRENFSTIENGNWTAIPQTGQATLHKSHDLPNWLTSWDMAALTAKKKYRTCR